MLRTSILALALAAGCRSDAASTNAPAIAAAPAKTDGQAVRLRFAWPVGSEAQVTERVLKKGRHATTRYRLTVEAEGDALLVYYRDFAFVEIEGVDLDDPETRAEITALERSLAGAIPPYRVARDGTWIGSIDVAALADRFTDIYSEKDREMLRSLLGNPKVRPLVDAKLREVWQAWAEGWIGLVLAPGARLEGVTTIDVLGTPVESPFTVARLSDEGGIRLQATQTLAGEQARAALGVVLEEVVAAMQKAPGKPIPVAQIDVRRVHLREATLDEATLLPRRASTRVTISVTHEGKTTEQIETHEWVFDWKAP